MSIVYPLSFPSAPSPQSARLSMRNVVASSRSPYSFQSQTQRHQGQLWVVDLTMPPLQGEAQLGEWAAFLTALRGRWGSFIWAPPDRNRGAFSASNNLLLWSEDFSNAAWTKVSTTVTSDATTAPDGTVTADKIVSKAATGRIAVHQTVTVPALENVSCSIYAKAAEWNWVTLFLDNSGTNDPDGNEDGFRGSTTKINLTTGVSSDPMVTTQDAGNGWWRLDIAGSYDGTDARIALALLSSELEGINDSIGDGVSGVYLWGAQLEEGAEPGTYAKTTIAGTPVVSGAGQTGEALDTSGWTASQNGVLKAGDLIQLGSGGSTRLHRVLADVDSDASGLATIDIWPRLRASPADGSTVVTANAAGLWRLSDDAASIMLEPALIARVQFSIEEAI